LDQELDHHMILHRKDPLVPVLQSSGEPLFLLEENPTAENLAKLIYERALAFSLPVVEVRLWETPTSMAAYHG
jgi:6-pyruvoyltetrahydropterin/6-carboxytetrahydropterin synthase